MRVLVAAGVILMGSIAPVSAESSPPTTVVAPTGGRNVDVLVSQEISRTESQQRRRRAIQRAVEPVERVQMMMAVELRVVGGVTCVYFFEVPGDPMSRAALEQEMRALRWVGEYPVCANSRVRPPVRAQPAAAAWQVWREQVELPSPLLHVAPGWAMVGRRAFLEVEGPRQVSARYEALGYEVVVEATSTLDVDWGDGTVEVDVKGVAGPWPSGQVSHVYERSGTYVVRVTLRWSASWRIGEATGTIDDQLVTAGELSLDARQVQAVRDR